MSKPERDSSRDEAVVKWTDDKARSRVRVSLRIAFIKLRAACKRLKARLVPLFGGKLVYIDCGAHRGELFTQYLDDTLHAKTPFLVVRDYSNAHFHMFEPNPECFVELEKVCRSVPTDRVSTYQRAVAARSGLRSFYHAIDVWGDLGGTLYSDKRTLLDRHSPIEVQCVDIVSVLAAVSSRRDYVVLKLDVEGAEYEIVQRFLDLGLMSRIDEVAIEWHDEKFPGRREHGELLRQALYRMRWLSVGAWE